MRKDVLNFFSPFPPTQSGVSDYSFAIAKRISRENDVLPIVKTPQEKDFLTSHGLAAEIFDKTTMPAGLSIFQIGNSAAHDYLFRAALKTPGIVVIHDLLLHGLIKSATLGYNEVAEYKSLMEFEGPSGHLVAERTLVGDFKPLYAAFVGGHRKLVEGALCVIVHSDWAAQYVRRENETVPIHVIPHFCDGGIDTAEREGRTLATRDQLGISKNSFVISHFGFVTESKQLSLLIRISLLLQEKLDLHLLIAGAGSRDLLSTERASLSLLKNKTIVDHLPEQMLNDSILASNLVSLLRYPSSGETSGIGARCMAMGRPVVCFDYYAYSDFPRDVAVHIPLDTFNAEAAAEGILAAVTSLDFVKKREAAALRWAGDQMHLSRIADSYNAVIASCREKFRRPN
jgi:glycosyltransferase involved in cell wall biosynthesis